MVNMAGYQFSALLTNQGWLHNAFVTLDHQGLITTIDNQPSQGVLYERVNGFALPGFQNAHSHAFQYAMAGLAERRNPTTSDDFWGWREAMYQIALTLNPDQLERVATMLYAEMVRHGYTHVAEFHYLHHDPVGKRYEHLAELGERLVRAAQVAGISITLVPMFYQMGGFGMPPQDRQRRFISSTLDAYLELFEATKRMTNRYAHAHHGFGVHSIRAIHPQDVVKALGWLQEDCPVHMHISEQVKEVEDAKVFLGARPVEWLLDNCGVNEQFHLVHATHLSDDEVKGIAGTRAHVVLCPSTEGNLGDGLFRLHDFQMAGGKWSIGTDSHVGLNPLEELRLLDYGQRLITHKRSSFYDDMQQDSGSFGFDMALRAGRKAMGNNNETYIPVGEPLNVVVYDASSPLLACSSDASLLSSIIYCADASSTLGTITNGQWIVKNGRHIHAEKIKSDFSKAMSELAIR
jgi:formimidoylglutamate deiminase